MTLKLRTTIAIALAIAAVAAAVGVSQLPGIGAGALLFPRRHPSRLPPPAGCVEQQFAGASITLSGWRCRSARGAARATVIYLHGIADNRDSAVGAISRFTSRGYDVMRMTAAHTVVPKATAARMGITRRKTCAR